MHVSSTASSIKSPPTKTKQTNITIKFINRLIPAFSTMPHAVKTAEQASKGPFELSNFPEFIPDTTVAFGACKAVPDVIDKVGDDAQLTIKYGSLPIENGSTVSPDRLLQEPSVEISPKNNTYTLMLVVADAPSPNNPKYRCWLHWLAINIPAIDIRRGEEVMLYQPPEPVSGRHRYLWLLFQQKQRVTAKVPAQRKGFQVKEWAKQHGLGDPCADLFFWCSADDEE